MHHPTATLLDLSLTFYTILLKISVERASATALVVS